MYETLLAMVLMIQIKLNESFVQCKKLRIVERGGGGGGRDFFF